MTRDLGIDDGLGLSRSRGLLKISLALWGACLVAALALRSLRFMFYPNYTGRPHFDLVSPEPLAAPIVWLALVAWCISWTSVLGHLTSALAASRRHPAWAAPALLLLSLASPAVFGYSISALLRLGTLDAYYRGDRVILLRTALVAQLAISLVYILAKAFPLRAGLGQAAGADRGFPPKVPA